MPRWDLQCPKCGRVYPDQHFPNVEERDAWLTHLVCDEPCHTRLQAVPSAPNFKLVGKGFHCNDYPKGKR